MQSRRCPATVIRSFLQYITVYGWEDVKDVDDKPGDLPFQVQTKTLRG